jgi:hypothetical protein
MFFIHIRLILTDWQGDCQSLFGDRNPLFQSKHHCRLIQIAKSMPANHATAITAYLIFLRVGTLDQVLAISETALLLWNL